MIRRQLTPPPPWHPDHPNRLTTTNVVGPILPRLDYPTMPEAIKVRLQTDLRDMGCTRLWRAVGPVASEDLAWNDGVRVRWDRVTWGYLAWAGIGESPGKDWRRRYALELLHLDQRGGVHSAYTQWSGIHLHPDMCRMNFTAL